MDETGAQPVRFAPGETFKMFLLILIFIKPCQHFSASFSTTICDTSQFAGKVLQIQGVQRSFEGDCSHQCCPGQSSNLEASILELPAKSSQFFFKHFFISYVRLNIPNPSGHVHFGC